MALRRSNLLVPLALVFAACGTPEKPKDTSKDAKGEAKDEAKASKDPAKPELDEIDPADPALVERGKYLVEVVMNCRACHTPLGENGPELARAYAGGLEYTESFGTWRSPNITQDKKTGIGGWTDEQIITAVREGKRPTGEQMYPIMPYQFFSAASDEDMKAVVAFLRTIPGIENAVAGNTDLTLPKPAHVPAEPMDIGLEDPVAEGRYLAQLAHCGDCHTPLKDDGSRDEARLFAGGREYSAFPFQGTGKVWAANLTPDPETGIGKYSEDEIMTAIVSLDKRDGSAIVGPMTFYTGAWSELKHTDTKALAAYLRSLPPIVNEVQKSTWQPPAP